jgi:hypothetical protein
MSNILRQHELRELVVALDQALDVIELCDFLGTADGSGGTLLALPLRDSFRLERALRRAADYLSELRYGRQP